MIAALGATAFAWSNGAPHASAAPETGQAPTGMPRIGVLALFGSAGTDPETDAFFEGLHELGYVEGRTIEILLRRATREDATLPQLAADLVAYNVDVIVALAPPWRRPGRSRS